MPLTNSTSEMIFSIAHTRTDTHTRTTLACQILVIGSLTDWCGISHSARANVHTKVQPYRLEVEHGCVSPEQECCYLCQRLYGPSDSSYISVVCVCARVSVCLNVWAFECICMSSLIALTPASVKWDSLPLSVFKSMAEGAATGMNWWIMQASSQFSLLALIETVPVTVERPLTVSCEKSPHIVPDKLFLVAYYLQKRNKCGMRFHTAKLDFSRPSIHHL